MHFTSTLNPPTRVFATAMKLMDVVEIEEAPSQALLDNNSGGGDSMNMPLDEVKYMGSDLRFELGLLERLAQYLPNALNAWRLDDSQIEDIEKPKRELQHLLCLAMQHQPIGKEIGPVTKTKSNNRRCHII